MKVVSLLTLCALVVSTLAIDDASAANGIISTYAGGGVADDGPATSAILDDPVASVVDASGNLYIADTDNHRVRKVNTAGVITTVAGTGIAGFNGDGPDATSARLNFPSGLAVDGAGTLYIADTDNHRVRSVTPAGVITTVAGTGVAGFSGDGGPAPAAGLNEPAGLAFDAGSNLYVADAGNDRVRKVDTAGTITTVAGTGVAGFSGDGGQATAATLDLSSGFFREQTSGRDFKPASGIAIDAQVNLYVADTNNGRVRKVARNGVITTVAGGGYEYWNDEGWATDAFLSHPSGIAVGGPRTLYIADAESNRIRKVDPSGRISTIAGSVSPGQFNGDGGPAIYASLHRPVGLTRDAAGALYVTDSGNLRVRKIDAAGVINTVAGSGGYFSGDGGPATSASLRDPHSVARDGAGNLYVVDTRNQRIRKVSPDGTITTIAGSGPYGCSPAHPVPATSAVMWNPRGIAVDGSGNVYFTDSDCGRVRKVDAAGIMTTVAGNGSYQYSGDSGPATSAGMYPYDVAVDGAGNLYIADFGNRRVRKVDTLGTITTVAGSGSAGSSGDGGLATSATLSPYAIALDSLGNLFIADTAGSRVRKVTPVGTISTVAGNGTYAFSGDGGPATGASMRSPTGLFVDSDGNVFIADQGNFRVRVVNTSGTINTVAGNGTATYTGDGLPATEAGMLPVDVVTDLSGGLHIADGQSHRIRKVG